LDRVLGYRTVKEAIDGLAPNTALNIGSALRQFLAMLNRKDERAKELAPDDLIEEAGET
jgi:hypothetical protein